MARINARWIFSRVGLILLVIFSVQLFSQLGFMSRKCQREDTKDEMVETFKKLTHDEEARKDQDRKTNANIEEKVEEDIVTTQKIVSDNLEGKLSIVDKASIAQELKTLALDLIETHRDTLTLPVGHRIDQHVKSINKLLRKLHEEEIVKRASSEKSASKKTSRNEVCPDKFFGKNLAYGYPYFRIGFARLNCTNYIPLKKLVTIIISISKELPKPADSYVSILTSVANLFPGISVIFTTTDPLSKLQLDQISKLKIKFQHHRSTNMKQGLLWQQLLGKVHTRYVLIAPDITHFTDDIFLERLVRVVSDNEEVVLSGGSYRNLKGEWSMGCQQSLIKNWTITYKEGYYFSFSDCLVCDFVPGPWLASTEKLRRFGFDER